MLGQRDTDPGRVGGPGDVADEAFVAGAILAGDDHRLIHPVEAAHAAATSPGSMR